MAFTALNKPGQQQKTTTVAPTWIDNEFEALAPETLESVKALWNGEPQVFNIKTTQAVISGFRRLIHELKETLRTNGKTISQEEQARANSPSKKRVNEAVEHINGHQEKKVRLTDSSNLKTMVSSSWKGTKLEGVSFTIPQRKKLALKISPSGQEGISATAPGSETPEFGIPWSDVEHIMYLPVPEKTQAQKSFVILPRGVDGLSESSSSPFEPIVWTVPDTKAKGAAEDDATQAQAIRSAIAQSFDILEPDPKDFTSQVPPPGGKKGERAYHIKAFKGSKDGYLFLLPSGILWAFKKPLIFFSFASIESISFTSVLQRTFNLVISARPPTNHAAEPSDYEFSMLDQADYEGVYEYIQKYGLQDASLAEQRRAKIYNVNGKKGEVDADGQVDGQEGESELVKAEREANAAAAESSDDEEEDENFDPGSDEDDGGSGSESESEDEIPRRGDRDLVGEELGSEAEDVEMTDEEDAEAEE